MKIQKSRIVGFVQENAIKTNRRNSFTSYDLCNRCGKIINFEKDYQITDISCPDSVISRFKNNELKMLQKYSEIE